MLSPLGYVFQVRKLPDVNFFLQRVTLPEISVTPVQQPNPFVKIPHPGDHIEYNVLDLVFKVDEDMNNYRQVHNWIRGTGFPEELDEYQELVSNTSFIGAGLKSDASLIITTNLKNPNIEIVFEDAFPTMIGALEFNTTDTTVEYLTCAARFSYKLFQIVVLP
jgi:hypothetical protein